LLRFSASKFMCFQVYEHPFYVLYINIKLLVGVVVIDRKKHNSGRQRDVKKKTKKKTPISTCLSLAYKRGCKCLHITMMYHPYAARVINQCFSVPPSYFYSLQPHVGRFLPHQIWWKSQNQAHVWPSGGGMTSPKCFYSDCLPLYKYIRGWWTLTACFSVPPSYFYSPMLAGFLRLRLVFGNQMDIICIICCYIHY